MASAAAATADQVEAAAPKKGGKKKLILLLVPVLLIGAGAGLWFSGILPGLLGMNPPPAEQAAAGEQPMPPPRPPSFLEMPDITANLNVAAGRRASFIRIRSKLELGRPEDAALLQAAMPRLLDLFQTYLREMRPEELRGSVGTHRLREELIARANLVAPPARIADVLFVEILIQ
jgi:flagellar protein FliL